MSPRTKINLAVRAKDFLKNTKDRYALGLTNLFSILSRDLTSIFRLTARFGERRSVSPWYHCTPAFYTLKLNSFAGMALRTRPLLLNDVPELVRVTVVS